MIYSVEYTDTFGGQANYSWVNRFNISVTNEATIRQVVMDAKSICGLTGVRCRRSECGETIELRPHNRCEIVFITPKY